MWFLVRVIVRLLEVDEDEPDVGRLLVIGNELYAVKKLCYDDISTVASCLGWHDPKFSLVHYYVTRIFFSPPEFGCLGFVLRRRSFLVPASTCFQDHPRAAIGPQVILN